MSGACLVNVVVMTWFVQQFHLLISRESTAMAKSMIRELRLERAWSQEQLAEVAGVSIRTVQRAENGTVPGLETLKALAAVFEMDVESLRKVAFATSAQEASADNDNQQAETEEFSMNTEQAESISNGALDSEYLRPNTPAAKAEFLRFSAHLLLVLVTLVIINWASTPDFWWAKWPALGIALAILWRAGDAFGITPREPSHEYRGTRSPIDTLQTIGDAFDGSCSDKIKAAQNADQSAEDVKREFYRFAIQMGLTLVTLVVINVASSPEYLWVKWPAIGIVLAVAWRAADTFGLNQPRR